MMKSPMRRNKKHTLLFFLYFIPAFLFFCNIAMAQSYEHSLEWLNYYYEKGSAAFHNGQWLEAYSHLFFYHHFTASIGLFNSQDAFSTELRRAIDYSEAHLRNALFDVKRLNKALNNCLAANKKGNVGFVAQGQKSGKIPYLRSNPPPPDY